MRQSIQIDIESMSQIDIESNVKGQTLIVRQGCLFNFSDILNSGGGHHTLEGGSRDSMRLHRSHFKPQPG